MEKNLKIDEKITNEISIKPHFGSYLFLGSSTLLFLITLIIISLGINFWLLSSGTANFFLTLGLSGFLFIGFLCRFIKFKKEKYSIKNRKIIYNYGNLFSDNSVEISLDKIVQVKSSLGFVQNLIFKTGILEIKTAGSSNSTVVFQNISGTMKLYEEIKNKMKKNGFNLKMDKLVQEEKPHFLGIIGEVFGKIFGGFVLIGYIIFNIYLEKSEETDLNIEEYGNDALLLGEKFLSDFIFIPMIFIVIFISFFIFKYLDLRKRKYQIFTDTIVYNEGFLTKNYSFIPMENISDTENTQSFLSKIFGLHDLVVSCAGTNNDVIFKNMVNGEKMMENIKYLKNETILNEKEEIEGESPKNSLIGFKDKTEKALNFDKSFQGKYKMHFLKSIFGLIIGLIPFGIISFFSNGEIPLFGYLIFSGFVMVLNYVQIKYTDFIIGESSIEKKYGFINTKHNTFSVEKITGVVFKESLIDKIFNTCSVQFWSIGSGENIIFKNIKKTPDLEKNIKTKIGIHTNDVQKEIISEITFGNYIKSGIIGFIITFAIYLIMMIVATVIILSYSKLGGALIIYSVISGIFAVFFFLLVLRFFYNKFYYSPKRYINKFYKDSIESIEGFFISTKSYSLFRNIKGIKTKKYPLTKTGDLIFNVAGEQIFESKSKGPGGAILQGLAGKNGATVRIISNTISIKFIKNSFEIFEKTDEIINENPIDKNSISSSKQDVGNSIINMILLFLIPILLIFLFLNENIEDKKFISYILAVFLVFFILIISLIILIVKAKFYDYQKDRIVFSSGIIYKQKQSILYKKFNYVENNQGFVNKIFKNGNLNIFTLGSGNIDLKIMNISNYKEVYKLFEKN